MGHTHKGMEATPTPTPTHSGGVEAEPQDTCVPPVPSHPPPQLTLSSSSPQHACVGRRGWGRRPPSQWWAWSHLQGWTDSRSGGGRWGWGSRVMVLCKWSVLMSSYICSGVSGFPFCSRRWVGCWQHNQVCAATHLIKAEQPEPWGVVQVVVGDAEVVGPRPDHAPFG